MLGRTQRSPLLRLTFSVLALSWLTSMGALGLDADGASSLSVDPVELIGAPSGAALGGAELEEATEELAEVLRCPVCQGMSVAASPSESALAMRNEIRLLLSSGYEPEQVMAYFEARYGEFVRLEPRFQGLNIALWLAPVVLLIVGGIYLSRHRRRANVEAAPPPESKGLDSYLEAVRREVGR